MNIVIFGRGNYSLLNRRVDSLREKGHRVFFVSLQKHSKYHEDNHYFKPFMRGLAGYLLSMPSVYKLLKRLDFQALDFHGASSYALFGLLVRRNFMISVYGPDVYVEALRNIFTKLVVNYLLSRAHTLSSSTSTVHDYLATFKGIQNKRYAIVPYGIKPLGGNECYNKRRNKFREQYGIDSSATVFLHCRRFTRFWRVDIIAKAFSTLHLDNSVLLFVYPSPSTEEQALISQVRQELDEAGVLDRVIFIDGLEYDSYLSAQCGSDCFVCIGENDMLANSVLEGMLCRNVMILNDLNSYINVLLKDEIVWLDKKLVDVESLALLMQQAYELPASRKVEMTQRNSQYIEQMYLESNCTDLLIAEYEDL
ncbi:Glycosyltransferase involved in cell wall bisynthesis [Mariprofundus ferrinatatus]|uniref:Glycosyltransferase involved in cell wall bisynthesis n=1 Tax=Mariprofundus ferrinatatus TaxID=1921087 RepID=A0A2K8L824_9PROT|nr:glycosyltransferase [Mariprofundus ferrinatatus]ATX82011.1 Glycosyltransferase involved in cell wall bisynthesis [Mariprofundus ferrinatatus]